MKKPIPTRHELENGRIYYVFDTGIPYVHGEYPTGGYVIKAQMKSGTLCYIDNAPDMECVNNFLAKARMLGASYA